MKSAHKVSWMIGPCIIIMLLGLLISGMVTMIHGATLAEEDPTSQVRMSWEEFKELLKLDTDEIKLTWEEFKRLLAQTGKEVKVEYNVQDGEVTLKREQFKKLLDQMQGPEAVSLKSPIDYLITKAEYTAIMEQKSTIFKARLSVEIFDQERTVYPKIRLLPKEVALRDIMIDSKPALVLVENGWYVLMTDTTGQHIIDMEFSVKSDLDGKPYALAVTIPQTAITLFKLEVPLKDISVEIPSEKHMTVAHGAGHTSIEAQLATTSVLQVKLQRTVAQNRGDGPAKIYSDVMNLLSIDDGVLRVTSRFDIDILQHTINEIDLVVPEGYSVLYVNGQTGQEIRGWRSRMDNGNEVLRIPLHGDIEGTVSFTIVAEKLYHDTDEVTFSGFTVKNAIRQTGYIGAEKLSSAEAQISFIEHIDRIDVLDLPRELVALSAKPLLFGLKYAQQPFAMTIAITKHEELPVVHTVIDNANVVTVFLKDGKVISRVVYSIQNTEKQFLELTLPEGAEIWSLYVDGERQVPARNEEGTFMIPLARSQIQDGVVNPFTMELLYFQKGRPFDIFGSGRIYMPRVDVVTSKLLWSCYFPMEYQFLHFGGNLDKEIIASGINPLLGKSRVFTYDEVTVYNKALENWEAPAAGAPVDKEVAETQRKLMSEFRSNSAGEKEVFLNQLREEINFAQNVQRGQDQGGMFMIEIPTSGQLYRFAKTIVKDEELYITVNYMQNWIGALARILFFAIIIGVVVLLRRWFVKAYVLVRQWVIAHKTLFAWLRTPAGTRTLIACGAIMFWFIAKVLFVILAILLIVSWFRPQWIFRHLQDAKKHDIPG
ncbi:hypothetical protein JXB22_01345 [candidate division WOR-3 bacterium]|nr:hypothetical protein [candidate division WOR-3 bacterium]